nr:MAG TPA: nucelotide kinase [Caudoviricetes sp.]
MNTNSKHYEELNIQPWEIMERNFTNEEFVAYLKGNIIKYTLRDKGQALTDAQKIKHYSEKLIEVLKTQENDKNNWTITGVKPEEVEDKHIIVKDSKFKIGDRVRIKYLERQNGTIIRQTVLGLRDVDEENYIVELDEGEEKGWRANKKEHLVDCEHAWYVDDSEIKLLPKKTLETNKWYDAKDYTVDELKELLPVGTVVTVTEEHDNNRTVNLEEETLLSTTVSNIGQRWDFKDTRVGITGDIYWRRYFQIRKGN